MKRIHLCWGAVAFMGFLATGYHMKTLFTETWPGGDAQRLMHRSAHVYIVFSAMLNVVAGLLYRPFTGWRSIAQRISSVALLATPTLFGLAFFLEQPSEDMKRDYVLPGVALSIVSIGTLSVVHCSPIADKS